MDLNPLKANRNLTELSLQRVMIRDPKIFAALEGCQKLTSLYLSVAETCSIDKKRLREYIPKGIDFKIFK